MIYLRLLHERRAASAEHPLKVRRRLAGMSVEDLTAATRLSPYFLVRVERGERALEEQHARLLAGPLQTDYSELLAGHSSEARV